MAQINQITKIRMPDGQEVAMVDWSHRVLYSVIDLFTGFSDVEIYAFTYTESDIVSSSNNITTPRTATMADTNIAQAGQMDATEECLIYSISTEYYSLAGSATAITAETGVNSAPMMKAVNMANLQRRLILELEVSQKAFTQAPLGWFNTGFGPNVANVAASGTANGAVNAGTEAVYASAATAGVPSHEARQMLQIPVHIGGTEKYKLILHNPGGTALNFVTDGNTAITTGMGARAMLRFNFDCLHKRPTA